MDIKKLNEDIIDNKRIGPSVSAFLQGYMVNAELIHSNEDDASHFFRITVDEGPVKFVMELSEVERFLDTIKAYLNPIFKKTNRISEMDKYERAICLFYDNLKIRSLDKYAKGKIEHADSDPATIIARDEIMQEFLDIIIYHVMDTVNKVPCPGYPE